MVIALIHRVFKKAFAMLPEGVEKVRLRSDTAGYQHALLRYCEKGEDARFGRIEFAIGADVTPEFKKTVLTEVGDQDWNPIYKEFDGKWIKTNQEWAEVCFVPNVNTIMKRQILGGSWASRRIKAIRFSFINIPGRIVERSGELVIRLVKGHPALDLYLEARRRILGMIPAPG